MGIILIAEGYKYLYALCFILALFLFLRIYQLWRQGVPIFPKQEIKVRKSVIVGVVLIACIILKFWIDVNYPNFFNYIINI